MGGRASWDSRATDHLPPQPRPVLMGTTREYEDKIIDEIEGSSRENPKMDGKQGIKNTVGRESRVKKMDEELRQG